MLSNFATIICRAFSHLSARLAARLLGPAARAGLIIADKDANLVGLRPGFPCRQSWHATQHAPFFNQVGAMTS